MADIHVLGGDGLGSWTIVFHLPVPDADNPINVARIIRSFDPCLACAIHLIDPKTNEIKKFIVEG